MDAKTSTWVTPAIQTGSLLPTATGTTARATREPTPARTARVGGIGVISGTRLRRLARRLGKRRAGTQTSTGTRMRNGTVGGVPFQGLWGKNLAANEAAMPSPRPPD